MKSLTSNFEKHGSYQYDQYQQNNTSLKAGKGYSKDTDPKGIPSGKPKGKENQPCPKKNCKGTIIAVMICTDVKGFETAVEHVCNRCGHVINTAMQILGKKEKEYNTFPYLSHQDWIERNCHEQNLKIPRNITEAASFSNTGFIYLTNLTKKYNNSNQVLESGIDLKLEYDVHYYGFRHDQNDTSNEHRDYGTKWSKINTAYKKAVQRAKGRPNNTKQSQRMPMDKWRLRECYEFIDYNLKDLVEATKIQVADVKWIIRNYGLQYFKAGTNFEEIITCILLWRMSKDRGHTINGAITKCRKHNYYNKQLYKVIKPKLDELKEFNFPKRCLVLMNTNKTKNTEEETV